MSEEETPSKILAQPLAVGLGAALLAGYALVTGFAIYTHARRASIEHVNAGYAVGDKTYFPKTFDPAQPLVNFQGHSLYYVDKKDDALDSSMIRAGMDDSSTYAIYKLVTAKGDEASFFYLKVGPNYYIKAKRQ